METSLTNYTPTITVALPPKDTLFKLLISLECKYNTVWYGNQLHSGKQTQNYTSLDPAMSMTKLTEDQSRSDSFLRSEGIQSMSAFPSIGVCAAFPSIGVCAAFPSIGVCAASPSIGVCAAFLSIGVCATFPSIGVCAAFLSIGVCAALLSIGVCAAFRSIGIRAAFLSIGVCAAFLSIGVCAAIPSIVVCAAFLSIGVCAAFPSIGVCAAFPSRRAYRNSSKGMEEMLLDGEENESAIVFSSFGSRNSLTLTGSDF